MSRTTADVIAVEGGKLTYPAEGMLLRRHLGIRNSVERGTETLDWTLAAQQAISEGRAFGPPGLEQWKVLESGTKSKLNLLEEMRGKGVLWFDTVTKMIKNLDRGDTKTIRLALPSVASLGLPKGGDLSEVIEVIRSKNCQLCPGFLALELRLDYLNQPMGRNIFMAMEPIDVDGEPNIFYLMNYHSGLQISSITCQPGRLLVADMRMIVVLS